MSTENPQDVFKQLKAIFEGETNYSNYWRLGHSFDTIIDYLVVRPEEAQGFGRIAIKAYNRSKDSAWWYDDYGWWGLASLKAWQLPKLFPEFAEFKPICDTCWDVNYKNATDVWIHNRNNPQFRNREPRFVGGIWNADWSKPRPFHSEAMCRQGDTLCGIQNTVTNMLYLLLGTRLYLKSLDREYGAAAKTEYDFLSHWFQLDKPSFDEHTLLMKVESGMLVRERVATFAEINSKFAEVPGYNKEVAWSGDQGLILGALVDRMRLVKGNDLLYSYCLKLASDIITGVKSQAAKLQGGTLTPWLTQADGGDPEDYATGAGVYWRYLQYASQNNTELKTYIKQTDQLKFVRQNAEHPQRAPGSDDLTDLTNRLAALTAVIVMSGN
jgi:hypothetical protein